MQRCPHCGEENPPHARFCGRCGRPLAAGASDDEERKIVTVLFCELTGAIPDDPEDLRRLLARYQLALGREISNYGGTVDKFMGTGALGVFGAPVAHEDDPERAVRAALRILEAVRDLEESEPVPRSVRIGVNTGEAVVARPGTGPQIGEAVTGDVVNTASRILAIAEPGEIVVGEPTYRATAHAVVYEEHGRVSAKGKSDPLALWRAVEARSRLGVDPRSRVSAPFVGRRDERSLLEGAFRRMIAESSVQMVTVGGEPGVGKSRLIQELGRVADEHPDLVRWRQGRSLPYGEGVSLWALGEIVKAEAGILESDAPADAAAKLADSLATLIADPRERDWVRARVAPLAGVNAGGADVPRDEAFRAWRRYVESLAARSPTVLVFEDLHWADETLLEFIEHLVDWTSGLPLLVVCAARPELYERRPDWGGGRRNSTSIMLPPLSDPEMAMLVSALLERAVLPAQTQAELLERSGGNPLYAEEFVRMLRDRGMLEPLAGGRPAGAAGGAGIPVPPTVQLLIGARLDTLPARDKRLLQCASVVGTVFWAGAVARMARISEAAAGERLHALVRREFIRPVRPPSIRGESEYSFWHVIVQDVAYGQIPRASRGEMHLAVASWIREIAGDRITDLAELLAHHTTEALALARATGKATGELERLAGHALLLAGERAKRLDASRAESLFRQARELLPVGEPDRTRVLLEIAEAEGALGRFVESERDFDVAMAEYRRAGDTAGLGETMARLARSVLKHGQEARDLLERAIAMLEGERSGPELARASTRMAGHLYVAGDNHSAIAWAERALRLADEVGLEDERVLALQYRGAARSQLGDRSGLDDLREALRLGLELGLGEETAVAYNNLALQLWGWEGPAPSAAVWEEMVDFCRARGFTAMERWAQAGALDSLFDLGEWDRVLASADDVLRWDRESGGTRLGAAALTFRGWVLLRRGAFAELDPVVDELLPRARALEYAEYLAPALILGAERELARGGRDEAVALVHEFVRITQDQPDYRRVYVPLAVRLLVDAGAVDEGESLLGASGGSRHRRQELGVLTSRAILAEARERREEALALFERSAREWTEFGFRLERGRSLLGAGRCLLALGRLAEAHRTLADARSVMLELGARPLLGEVDALLARATAGSS
ncbi:MAG TPA: AAA family ATPase [Actinomycetota bacterium]|nr:AAA family ATPase [Actinomycetota bacterium]